MKRRNHKMKFIGLLTTVLFILLATSVISLEPVLNFGITCPTSVSSGLSFECTVALVDPVLAVKGLSFSVDAGSATISDVTFIPSVVGFDGDIPGTYGFFTFATPLSSTEPFATITLETSSFFTLGLTGIRANLDDDTELGPLNMIFPSQSVTIFGNGVCGDGVKSSTEQCDGLDLDGQDCTYFGPGFTGTLSCATESCRFNVDGCILPPAGPTPRDIFINEMTSTFDEIYSELTANHRPTLKIISKIALLIDELTGAKS